MQFNGKLDLDAKKILKSRGLNDSGRVQKVVDTETIKFMAEYTPFTTGGLVQATWPTIIGSGLIVQRAPQARYLHYGKLMVDPITKKGAFKNAEGMMWSRPGVSKELTDIDLNYNKSAHPKAGPFWFERMKADRKGDILKAAQAAANRGDI